MKPLFAQVALVSVLMVGWVNGGRAQEDGKGRAKWPELTPVSVDLVAASMTDMNEALSKATGVRFVTGQSSFPSAFTLSMKERPFWEVFEALSKQNTLVYRPSRNGIELNSLGTPVPMLVSGPVLVLAEVTTAEDWAGRAQAGAAGRGRGGFVTGGSNVIPRYTGRGPGAERAPPEGSKFVLRLAAIADPRLATGSSELAQVEVRDDAGNPMQVLESGRARVTPAATTGPWQPRASDYDRINLSAWRVTLAAPQGDGKAVGLVKGVLKMVVGTKEATEKMEPVEVPFEIKVGDKAEGGRGSRAGER